MAWRSAYAFYEYDVLYVLRAALAGCQGWAVNSYQEVHISDYENKNPYCCAWLSW
jgi:hypothetical protein